MPHQIINRVYVDRSELHDRHSEQQYTSMPSTIKLYIQICTFHALFKDEYSLNYVFHALILNTYNITIKDE